MLIVMMFCGAVGAAVLAGVLLLGGLAGWWARGVRDAVDRRTRDAPSGGDLPLTEEQARRLAEEQEALARTMGYSAADAYGLTRNDAWPGENRPPGKGG